MPPARRGRAKAARTDLLAASAPAGSDVNGSGWAACMPAQQQQRVAPTPAPLPGGFKSMKNRWLAEFEAEQAAKQAVERAAHTAQQDAAAAASAAREPMLKAEAAGTQAPAGVVRPAGVDRQPHGTPAAARLPAEQDRKAQQPAGEVQNQQSNGAAAKQRGEERETAVPGTSSAHSEAEQQLRIPSEDQVPAHQQGVPDAVRSAVPHHLVIALEQDVASPASDADSTKQHSPAGRIAPVGPADGQHAAATATRPGSDDTAAGQAGHTGQRKGKADAGADLLAGANRLTSPSNGEAPATGAEEGPGQTEVGSDLPSHPPQAAERGSSPGREAAARPAAAPQSEQRLQPPHAPQDSRLPANVAEPQTRLSSPKQQGTHAAVSPVQNGRKARPQPGSGRGGISRDIGKVNMKLGPPASRCEGMPGADALAAPSQRRIRAANIHEDRVKRRIQPHGQPAEQQQQKQQQRDATAPRQAERQGANNATQLAAEPARRNGSDATAPLPVGLHYFSSSGNILPLGEVDLQGCSCRAEVLREIYARHGASLPVQDSVKLTYEDDAGDWMLMHDATPWREFEAGARRLLVTA